MKVLLPLISLVYLAFAQENCRAPVPVKCGPEDMPCYGGSDYNGCPYGDFCWPAKGNVLKNDNFHYIVRNHVKLIQVVNSCRGFSRGTVLS